MWATSAITLSGGDGDRPSVVMTYSGQPIGQPVAMGGPFAMNSHAEIAQAFRDLHSGQFTTSRARAACSTADPRRPAPGVPVARSYSFLSPRRILANGIIAASPPRRLR